MGILHAGSYAILAATLAILVSGFAKGVSGLGLPILATPVMAVLFGLKIGIDIALIPTVVSDIAVLGLVYRNFSRKEFKRIVRLVVPSLLGIAIGLRILVHSNSTIFYGILGLVVAGFVITSVFRLLTKFRDPPLWVEPIVGLVAGLLQGTAGASGPIISMYLYQLDLERSDFLFTINAYFLIVDTMELVSALQVGMANGSTMHLSALAVIPTVVGIGVAMLVQRRITPRLFQGTILVLLSITAVTLLGKAAGVGI